MKLALFLLLATCLHAGPDKSPDTRPTGKSLDAVRNAFSYDSGSGDVEPDIREKEAVVEMDPMLVDETYAHVARAVDEHAKKTSEGKFNAHDGGAIAKSVGKKVTSEVKLQFDAKHKGFDIISFSW